MMTLIALAITVTFFYSAAVTFGLPGKTFYWELATLIELFLPPFSISKILSLKLKTVGMSKLLKGSSKTKMSGL